MGTSSGGELKIDPIGSHTGGWLGATPGAPFLNKGIAKLLHQNAKTVPETPVEKAQADVAKQQWTDYQKRWSPVITYYKNRNDQGLGNKKEMAAGEANTDIQAGFGKAGDALGAALRGRGVTTGSGKDIAARSKLNDSKSAALGGGLAVSQDAVDAQYQNAIQSIVGIGRGERVQADQALNTLAGLSGEQAGANAQAAAQDAAGLGEALGVGLGGAAAYGLAPRGAQAPQATKMAPMQKPQDWPMLNEQPAGI